MIFALSALRSRTLNRERSYHHVRLWRSVVCGVSLDLGVTVGADIEYLKAAIHRFNTDTAYRLQVQESARWRAVAEHLMPGSTTKPFEVVDYSPSANREAFIEGLEMVNLGDVRRAAKLHQDMLDNDPATIAALQDNPLFKPEDEHNSPFPEWSKQQWERAYRNYDRKPWEGAE